MKQKYYEQNANVKVFIKDRLYPRNEAKISVFDSAVQGGDAVWEGLRIYNGKIFSFDEHIERLQNSGKILAFGDIPSREFILNAVKQTLQANNFFNDAHIRLTLTRGEKITSGMDPRLNQSGSCLIVLAEYKPPVYDNVAGIKLITSHIRRNSPMHLDSKVHHNNMLNNILAKIEANYCGADDAIMLDNLGFVAETNACNIFLVKDNCLHTPHADACLPGITRKNVIKLGRELGIPVIERNISIGEFYTANEVFTTGTMGELTPVKEIDGRIIENKQGTGIRAKLSEIYRKLTETTGEPVV
ncbi:amino-transferase class IV domain-containing protein [Ditylenchus destructor]|nr:amino-transferase class IV domain-containing protein [Ditylenchus destructor]